MTEYGQQLDWVVYFAMIIVQAVVWAWLYNKTGPLRKPIHQWILKDEKREENILANGQDTKEVWSMWIVVTIHHSLGGILALVGGVSGNIWLFRLGLSFEIGEDYLHYLQMIWTALGNYTEMFVVLWPEKHVWLGLAFHHIVGAVGGSFVFIYIPNNPTAQYCVVLLLLSAMPQMFGYPFMPFENFQGGTVSCLGRLLALVTLLGTLFAFVSRVFLFPPAAFDLAGQIRPGYGDGVANTLLTVSGLFMIFAVAMVFVGRAEWGGAFKNLFAVAPGKGGAAEIANIGEHLNNRGSIRSQRDLELVVTEGGQPATQSAEGAGKA